MTIKVRIITPHVTPRPQKIEEVAGLNEFLNVAFSHVNLTMGPTSIQGMFDDGFATPGIVARCIEAERDGVNAVLIDCMGDPGLDAAREAVSIPVLGPGETTMHVAAMLGHKFAVVTVLDQVRPLLEKHAKIYGLQEKLASVRAVEVAVNHIGDDPEGLLARLLEQSKKAVVEDHADCIVLGCTGFLGVSDRLQAMLHQDGLMVPVLNPLRTTASLAVALAGLGLRHSPRAYARADISALVGYGALFAK